MSLTGELREEGLEVGIVSDDENAGGRFGHVADGLEELSGLTVIEVRAVSDRNELALGKFRPREFPSLLRAEGGRAENEIGAEADVTQDGSHARGGFQAASLQRAVVIVERGVRPARLGVTEEEERFHDRGGPSLETKQVSWAASEIGRAHV